MIILLKISIGILERGLICGENGVLYLQTHPLLGVYPVHAVLMIRKGCGGQECCVKLLVKPGSGVRDQLGGHTLKSLVNYKV